MESMNTISHKDVRVRYRLLIALLVTLLVTVIATIAQAADTVVKLSKPVTFIENSYRYPVFQLLVNKTTVNAGETITATVQCGLTDATNLSLWANGNYQIGKSKWPSSGHAYQDYDDLCKATWSFSFKEAGEYVLRITYTTTFGTESYTVLSKPVTVVVKGKSIKPNPKGITISGPDHVEKGKQIQLTSKVTPAGADQSVRWSSSDEKTATVDSKGNVTGKKTGTVRITATSKSNKKIKQSCQVEVTKESSKLKYEIKKNYSINDKKYYQAELLKTYNGVQEGALFFLDSKKEPVTNPTILEMLFKMWLFTDSINSNNGTLKTQRSVVRINMEAAKDFIENDALNAAAGRILGIGIGLSINPITWGDALMKGSESALDIATVLIQMRVFDCVGNNALVMIDNTRNCLTELSKMKTIDDKTVTDVMNLYATCWQYINSANKMARETIDGNLAKYKNNWDLFAKNLETICENFIKGAAADMEGTVSKICALVERVSLGNRDPLDLLSSVLDMSIEKVTKNDAIKALASCYASAVNFIVKGNQAIPGLINVSDRKCLDPYNLTKIDDFVTLHKKLSK